MLPSLTSVTGFSGFFIVDSVSMTSVILLADSIEKVNITKIIDSIIRLISICML